MLTAACMDSIIVFVMRIGTKTRIKNNNDYYDVYYAICIMCRQENQKMTYKHKQLHVTKKVQH